MQDTSTGQSSQRGDTDAAPPIDPRFTRYKLLHGLVVYRDPGSHPAEPESLMTSLRVHGSPARVLAALRRVPSPEHSCFWALSDVREAPGSCPETSELCFRATVAPPVRRCACASQPKYLQRRDLIRNKRLCIPVCHN